MAGVAIPLLLIAFAAGAAATWLAGVYLSRSTERELGGCKGGRHWHLRIPGRAGTLEVNECGGQVRVKVHPRRDGGWAGALAAEFHAMPRS